MESIAERKFVNLRRRLDQLGYMYPLGIENLPLVEKLFSDLVHTTESLRNAKLSAKSEKESQNCDVLLEPYRADNARLVKENNQLHLALLKAKEEMDHITRELKTRIRKLDHDACDLKFLNNQYAHKVRCLEKDGRAKAERILQLQEKNLQAVVQTPGGKKRSIAFRRQRLQIDELIPPPETSGYPVAQPDDPYIADLLQLADNRILELQDEITKVQSELDNTHECIQLLNTQIGERDKEIERLNRALHGGRPRDVVSLEAQNVSNEKLIAQLNLQVEYLQESNKTLEQEVEGLQHKSSNEVADLSLKNFELCQELTHIDGLAQRMEMDKERVLEMADVELRDNKEVIRSQQEVIEELEENLKKITAELSERDFDKGSFEEQLLELRRQNEKLEGTLEVLEAEKSRLQDKVEKMMSADKDMVLELEAMRAKHGVCGRERSPSRLDAFVKSLEEERERYRQEAERSRRVRASGSPVRSPVRSRSPGGNVVRGGVAEADMLALVKERDELKAVLQEVEEHTEDIQTNVKALSAERDHFKAMFYQAQEQLQDAWQSSSSSDDVLNLKEELRLAESKILQVRAERDLLMEEFKVGQTSALPNGHGQEQRILDMQNGIHHVEQENLELRSQLFALKDSKRDMEQKLDVQSSALLQNAEEAAQYRKASLALRLQQEQMQQELSDLQHKLSVKTTELRAAREQTEIQNETMGVLRQQVSKHKQEAEVLRISFSALDKEKDGLLDEVDQKTEKMVVLQEELENKAKTLEDVRLAVTAMDKSMCQLQGALNSRERELASLRKQLDDAQMELAGLRKTREITAREKRNLQDDLTTMTRENQAVHAEMGEALRERDELKLRVHSYIATVARVENLLKTKDQENLDLLARFRTALSDVQEREHRLQQFEELKNSVRLDLLSSDTERRHLLEAVGHQKREIQQHVQALQAYEDKVSSLARAMARLEEELRRVQEENASLVSDLATVRELCVKLESAKDLTARHVTSKSMELERVEGELEDVRSVAELLKKQLASERVTVRNLETLLSTNRQKDIQTHLTASEKESELKVLRDRLTLADNKNAEHARDVSNLRTKVSKLQAEMDVLNRQLTSERFQNERTMQEMRRLGVSISPLRSSSSLNVTTTSQSTSNNSSADKSDN
ncbi:centrosomal protein of 135 kDa [Phyllopteryx taeniolatus]|uniref:centrosomal protein of 135 kDa n=1 Tax=Phyllopteryx taeniolatus TaxID=161469 RepID=UPI002AD4ECFC|nr:centrosomal protein of 135 kDa [Phyllopteryx taeniolatus]XP_061635576.1 centrosomal protein of 135 kDa [Phyllopteryx taeniolatus]